MSLEVNIKLSQRLSKSFINNAIRGVVLLTSGRKNVYNVSALKKMTNSYLKTIAQYLYCQSAVKFWRDYSSTQCLSFSSKTTWSNVTSPVLKQYQLTYFHHLWNVRLEEEIIQKTWSRISRWYRQNTIRHMHRSKRNNIKLSTGLSFKDTKVKLVIQIWYHQTISSWVILSAST